MIPYAPLLIPCTVCWLDSTACRTGHAKRHDPRIDYQRPPSIERILQGSGHQRINGTFFVFSAAFPAVLAVSASDSINILRNTPSILSALQESVHAIWAVLNLVEAIRIASCAASAVPSTSASTKASNPATTTPRETPSFDIPGEGRLLQGIVDEALAQGVWIHAPEHPARCCASARPPS